VTLPAGVSSGQTVHVQAPDGRLNEIVVPEGFGPGSTFTVEFADDPSSKYKTSSTSQSYPVNDNVPISTAVPAANNAHDDGFASGFNNPSFVAQPPMATTTNTAGMNLTPYVTADAAKPVYSTTPQYNASPY